MREQDIPQSWAWSSLGEVADYGKTTKVEPSEIKPEEWVLELEDIEKDTSKLLQRVRNSERLSRSAKNRFSRGDVLYGKLRPYLNKVLLADEDGVCSTEIVPLTAPVGIDKRYLFYSLKRPGLVEYVTNISHGLNMPRIGTKAGRDAQIAIAPFDEQKQIADKLDTLLARVDVCRERLDRVSQVHKRFRQAVLAAATSGALTEEWRNTGAPEWRHVCLADIADIQGGVTKDSKKQQVTDEEVPYLRVANVQRGYLDLNEIKTIRIPSNKITSILLEPGDILFNEGGDIDKLGRGWIWEGQIPRCSFQNHVFRVRLFSKSNHPKYISWWGNSRGIEYFLRQGKQTTNLASINKTMLGNLPISLPPPDEQQEIVRRVETLFAFADRLEARYNAAHTQVENMAPALLAKAFCGELVPQDPTDEPASELLKRIKEQKANEPEQKRKPRANTIKNERNMNTKAATTLDELVSVLDQLGGDAMADRLVIESGLSDDIDRFFELLREGRNTLLDVPLGSNKPIRRIVDANQ